MPKKWKMGVIGAGRLGRAFLAGLLHAKIFKKSEIWVAEKFDEALAETKRQIPGLRVDPTFDSKVTTSEIIFLCVKPAQVAEVLKDLREYLNRKTLLISVAAGTTTHKIEGILESENPVVRAMPNSPAAVGSAITAVCCGSHASNEHLKKAERIFSAIGKTLRIEEKYFDLVTAVSGSGPAYFYTMIEALVRAGIEGGLNGDDALALAAHTAVGAGKMVESLHRSPDSLRRDVATPGGCTIEALDFMDAKGFSQILIDAVKVATERASRLGQG